MLWDRWSRPYIERIVKAVKATHPHVPLTLYANGCGGLLERMAGTGVDVVGLDWSVDMADARARLGSTSVQGNVDPVVLFSSQAAIEEAVRLPLRSDAPPLHTAAGCPSAGGTTRAAVSNCRPQCLQRAPPSHTRTQVRDCLKKAGPKGHVLNLGHGVLVGTPEENVAFMFDLSKRLKASEL